MSRIEIQTVEYVWLAVRKENPVLGDVDPTADTPQLSWVKRTGQAVPAAPAAADVLWVDAVWETGTMSLNGEVWYLIKALIGVGTSWVFDTVGVWYPFVKIVGATEQPVVVGDPIEVY